MDQEQIFVAQEGRLPDKIGLKLLCLSIARYEPAAHVMLYVSRNIREYVCQLFSGLPIHIEVIDFEGKDWSCKPTVLLDALRRKKRRVTWIDSDALLIGKASVLCDLNEKILAIAEESSPGAHRFVNERQKLLGLPEGPSFDTTLSSAVLSVTAVHQEMLQIWSDLMTTDAFVSDQNLERYRRKLFYGDQEVLEAVVCSYPKFPVKILLNDIDLLQANWYDKVRRCEGRAPFAVHATGDLKPWKHGSRFNQEMFPYFEAARVYWSDLTTSEQEIFTRQSRIATIIKYGLGGFPTYRTARRFVGRLPRSRTLIRKLKANWRM